MTDQPQTTATWRDIARAILARSKQDFRSRLVPPVTTGRNNLGSWIEAFGRKLQSTSK